MDLQSWPATKNNMDADGVQAANNNKKSIEK